MLKDDPVNLLWSWSALIYSSLPVFFVFYDIDIFEEGLSERMFNNLDSSIVFSWLDEVKYF